MDIYIPLQTPRRYRVHFPVLEVFSPWASLVAQMVKNLPGVHETQVQSLSWEHPPEKGMANHSSSLASRIPIDRGAWLATVNGSQESKSRT